MNSFNKIGFKKEYNYKRLSPEKEDFRSAFQRDRDRVFYPIIMTILEID